MYVRPLRQAGASAEWVLTTKYVPLASVSVTSDHEARSPARDGLIQVIVAQTTLIRAILTCIKTIISLFYGRSGPTTSITVSKMVIISEKKNIFRAHKAVSGAPKPCMQRQSQYSPAPSMTTKNVMPV